MMPADKQSLTQLAVASPTGLSRSHKLPFAEKETAPAPVLENLPPEIETVTESQLLPPNKLYIDLKMPPEVAILHVYQQGDNRYSLWGGNGKINLPSTPPMQSPKLSLSKVVQEPEQPENPENIKFNLSHFSRINLELRRWLKQLRQCFGKKLSLVIVDHTSYEIPWEAIELSPFDSPNEYLGALIATVRWRQVIRGDNYLVLKIQSDCCHGNTVAYLLDSELTVNRELETLEELQSVIYRSSIHSIRDFLEYLRNKDCHCALVYVGCHATFKENIHEVTLGSNSDKDQQLKLQSLYEKQLNLLKNSQGIVFMNTCHSGREQTHPTIPHHYRLGFIDLFLEKGARGVIGTLGAVGNQYATRFACDLMKETLSSPNVPVAEIMRKLRAKVIENLSENPTTEDLLSFIYTFMYVYYGNPMTVLRLTPAGGNPDV